LVDSRTVASTAVFTAFVAASTMVFTLAIPATPSGYFNFGEVMVYICALLMGPYVGAFAGGVGSSIADVALGAPNYAPGTLVIKGAEGFIVGWLSSKAGTTITGRRWRATSIVVGAAVGLLLGGLGAAYYAGSYTFTIGFPVGPQYNLAFDVPVAFWVGLGVVVFAAIAAVGYLVNEKVGWTVFSVLAGGSAMYTGYFLYNYAVLAIGYAGSAGEFPFDVGQALIGLVVAVPVVSRVRKMRARTGAPMKEDDATVSRT
jgi:uncharacterized membrane protein